MNDFLDQLWAFFPAPMQEKLSSYAEGFWTALPNIIIAIVFLFFVWLVSAVAQWIAGKAARRAHLRDSLVDLSQLLVRVVVWVFGLLIAATIAIPSLTISGIFAAAGVGGLAVAFAARDTLENFFAGVNLLIRDTFQMDDYVECQDIEGQVERITMRETWIRQTDGQLVVAPNQIFFQNPLTIRTSQDKRRTTIICGVAYDEDVDEAREVIRKAVESVDSVKSDENPVDILAQEFGASSINFEVTWWTGPKPRDIRESRDEVVAAVKRALDEAGIEIPFPYRTLTFKEPLPLQQRDRQDDAPREAAE